MNVVSAIRALIPHRVPGPNVVFQIGKWLLSVHWRDEFAASVGRDMIGICPFFYLSLGPYIVILLDPTPLTSYDR